MLIPNELIIAIGTHLPTRDLYHLILVNHRFSILLLPRLRTLSPRTKHAKAALYWAVLSGDRDLARHVLNKGGKIAVTRTSDNHVVHRAPGECDDEAFEWVMGQGANLCLEAKSRRYIVIGPRPSPSYSVLAIEYAIDKGHHALLRLALSAGGLKNAQFYSEVVFFASCCERKLEMEIIQEWISSSLGEEMLMTILDMALCRSVEDNYWASARLLLGKGADPNVKNSGGIPVLSVAVSRQASSIVRVLLEQGADIDVEDDNGNSPLSLANGPVRDMLEKKAEKSLARKERIMELR